ncbi:glycosyltransferase [Streptomyces sp. 8K308]|uniref:glycosyltransferase family 2 protein n=1 Tax=Streptomyces sp. 8K308 TaxID=2530388 RepID=UPI0010529CDD|nr:glycosyltransferase [Streptomyces sp. 8K308]TDC23791.1 glycosyltransferase [Streptomyces sp. 8K308]
MPDSALTVVIATRDRCDRLAGTLRRLTELPENPRILVVDNASTDGTRRMLAERFPAVRTLGLPVNRGALARNEGVAAAPGPYVAFSDDDSWWEPGSLARAVELLEAEPRVGLVAARTRVAPDGTPDPIDELLAGSPLRGPAGLPGPPVLGFLGCAAVVRRSAFLAAGGFHPLLFFGAEETLLAYDMAATGWILCHDPRVIAVHGPDPGPRPGRATVIHRNEALTAWLRRPLPVALAHTWRLARRSLGDGSARGALAQLLLRLPAALAARRPLPAAVEAAARHVELARDTAR